MSEVLSEYEYEEDLQRDLDSIKKDFQKVESAYKPSGLAPTVSKVLMLLASPVVTLVIFAVIYLTILFMVQAIEETAGPHIVYSGVDRFIKAWQLRRLSWGLYFISTLYLGLFIMAVPAWLYAQIGKILKIRKAAWSVLLTGMTAFAAGIIFFWPIWHGQTLVPSQFKLLGIPLKWTVVLFSGVFAPILSMGAAFWMFEKSRFCEITGKALKRMRRLRLSLDRAEEVRSLLNARQYAKLSTFQKISKKEAKNKSHISIVLWAYPKAQTGYLEAEFMFKTFYKPDKKSVPQRKEESWLIHSGKLAQEDAMNLSTTLS